MSARINLSPSEAERLLADVCEKTGTTPELWDELAAIFLDEPAAAEGET